MFNDNLTWLRIMSSVKKL